MSDFEQLVRQTGFLLQADVGHGAQDLVLTVSALGLTGTQVAALKDVEAAGFVKADRLQQAEASLAKTQSKLTELDRHHTELRGDHAKKLEALQRAHEAELAALRAELEGRHEEQRQSLEAQLAAAREALSDRQTAWSRDKERLEDALDDVRATRETEREAAADALAAAREELAAAQRAWAAERVKLTGDIRAWEARHHAEREGIQARNEGVAIEANPYRPEGQPDQAAHQAWRSGWTLRDGLLRLNEHAHQLQAERDQLIRAMEHARPEVERLLEENQRLTISNEALRAEILRLRQQP